MTNENEQEVKINAQEEVKEYPKVSIKADLFKNYFSIINNLITETKIILNKEGLNLIAMDSSNISMIKLVIPTKEFLMYNVKEDTEFYIKIQNLMPIIKDTKKEEYITFEIERTKLNIKINQFNYNIPLIDLELKDQQEPSLVFKLKLINYDTKTLKEIFKNASKISETIIFSKEEFKSSNDINNFNFLISENNAIGENVKCKYSLDYLNNFFRSNKLPNKIVINFSNEYPLMIEQGYIKFILAPRINNED